MRTKSDLPNCLSVAETSLWREMFINVCISAEKSSIISNLTVSKDDESDIVRYM